MTKRWPQDYTHKELAALVLCHQEKHAEAATKLADTRDKLIEARKELSKLKRDKK